MKITTFLLLVMSICFCGQAQKKSKGKDNKKQTKTETISVGEEQPTPDTAHLFKGLIKYYMLTDDPSQKDSMFIVFGENQLRFTMFTPGYKEGQIFETNMISNFMDSTLYTIDTRNKTYHIEKFGDRNAATEFTLVNRKKTAPVMKTIICSELSGSIKSGEDEFEAAALVSRNHSYLYAMDYNFLNIQPVIMGYRIVLGFRTKSNENESTLIVAYKIEPGDVKGYFDLTGYRVK